MKLTIVKELLLSRLQLVAGIVEKRHAMPILTHLKLTVQAQVLSLAATDLETELNVRVSLEPNAIPGEITVSLRKLMDICRTLPDSALIEITLKDQTVIVKSGKSRFSLNTLPAKDYPSVEYNQETIDFSLPREAFLRLLKTTSFSMAQQDVRHFLNGMMLDIQADKIRAASADGHRLAISDWAHATSTPTQQVIIPRKAVMELIKLLAISQTEMIDINISDNHIRIVTPEITFISKLIDARFPDCEKVIPKQSNKKIIVDSDELKQVIMRISAVLSGDNSGKVRAATFLLRENKMKVFAKNNENDEAEEDIDLTYNDGDMDIKFNVTYILDVLNNLDSGNVHFTLSDSDSSILIGQENNNSLYVVMPMKI